MSITLLAMVVCAIQGKEMDCSFLCVTRRFSLVMITTDQRQSLLYRVAVWWVHGRQLGTPAGPGAHCPWTLSGKHDMGQTNWSGDVPEGNSAENHWQKTAFP